MQQAVLNPAAPAGCNVGRGRRGYGMLGYLQSGQPRGQVAGPVIGGVIGVHLGLRAVFFVTGALLIACCVARTERSKRCSLTSPRAGKAH